MPIRIAIYCFVWVFSAQFALCQNWPQFRGGDSRGVADHGGPTPPDEWSAEKNIAWKAEIPGRGWSSPVVWGDRVFMTSVINHGESEPPKKGLYFGGNRPEPPASEHEWIVVCLDLSSGKRLWKKTLHQGTPETSIHLKNSFASETPVADGSHLYVVFGGLGLFCLDFNGNEVWSHPLVARKTRYGWGTASSPVLHGDRLYYVDDNDESSSITAFDKTSGEVIWRVDREEKSNWSTPFVWQNRLRTEIVTLGSDLVRSYDLDGNVLWTLSGMSSITIATPYQQNGLLMISSGYVGDQHRPLYAIRPGASGDISLGNDDTSNDGTSNDDTSNQWVAWSDPQGGPYNPTTITYNDVVYVLLDFGFMMAFDAVDGSEVFSKQRIPRGRAFTASPWAYNGKIFCLNEDGVTFVFNAGREFELIGTNKLGEDEMAMATPAIVGDRLLIRTSSRLYCVQSQQ